MALSVIEKKIARSIVWEFLAPSKLVGGKSRLLVKCKLLTNSSSLAPTTVKQLFKTEIRQEFFGLFGIPILFMDGRLTDTILLHQTLIIKS